ncbi:AAA family ATPase [archaeon]|nr:AAA family ATPase [archaeon]
MSIAITGTPGVGKHTITYKIADRLNLPILDINLIAKDSGLFEQSKDTNDIDTEKLRLIFEQKISKGKIIVGHLAPYVLNKNQIKIMIVLRRSPYELISVYKDRKYTKRKIKENAGSEILGIIAHDATNQFHEKVFQINVSKNTISETVEKAIRLIFGDKNNEIIDWLELVKNKNDLEKFFGD